MDITGFDQQIGVVKKIAKAAKKASKFVNKKTAFMPQPKVTAIKRAVPAKRVMPAKSVAPAKTIAVKRSMINKLVAAKKMQTTLPARSVAPAKSVAVKRSMINKLIAAKKVQAPTQKSPIVTAKQFSAFKSTAKPSQPVKRTLQASQPVKVFSTDKRVSPAQLKSMDDVKRSFAKVDLPYQPVTPPTKIMRVKNSPINLPININMIEPAVDGGVNDYYGK